MKALHYHPEKAMGRVVLVSSPYLMDVFGAACTAVSGPEHPQ